MKFFLTALLVTALQVAIIPGVLSGVVRDRDGAIPGAVVTGSVAGVPYTALTNEAGTFRLGLPPGPADVTVAMPGYVTASTTVTIVKNRETVWNPTLVLAPRRWRPPPTDPDSVENYVIRFTGPDAVNCGDHGKEATEAELRRSLGCALDASRAHKPFRVMIGFFGADSWMATGLVGQKDGVILKFDYDTLGCMNGPPDHPCAARFSICPKPDVRVDHIPPVFTCAVPSSSPTSHTSRSRPAQSKGPNDGAR